jgi:hypothetical protein
MPAAPTRMFRSTAVETTPTLAARGGISQHSRRNGYKIGDS